MGVSGLALLMTASSCDFQQLYREHVNRVWRVVSRLGVRPGDVEDAVQDVFVVAHRRLATLDPSAASSWFTGIAVRVAHDYRRRDVRKPASSLEAEVELRDRGARPDELVAQRDALDYALQLLERMPAEQRDVFVLAELEQLTAPEIADATSVPINTVYSRLRLARARFNELVAAQEKDHE